METIVNEIYKASRKNFKRRPVVLKSLNDLCQMDLADFQKLAKENSGYKYILVGINCFTKMACATPVKNKTALVVGNAAIEMLDKKFKTKFKNLQTDKGNEFKELAKTLKDRKVNYYMTESDLKASIVERVIKTLKIKIYKDCAIRGSLRYVDNLEKIVASYNSTKHTKTGLPPDKVRKKHEKMLLNSVYNYKREIGNPRYKIGDYVRLSSPRFVFTRSFNPSWTPELFKITAVNKKIPITYKISNYEGTEEIKGTFYEPELQKTSEKDVFLVQKVLKKRGNKVLIRWLGYPQLEDSWELSKNLILPRK